MYPSTKGFWAWKRAVKTNTGGTSNGEVIAAPGSGKRIFVWKIIFHSFSTAGIDARVTEGTDAAGTRIFQMHGTNTTYDKHELEFPFVAPYALPENTALNMTNDLGNVSVTVYYFEG